ncbi:MAG: cohesin domain-containing protein [Patescibacteria group bacterium]
MHFLRHTIFLSVSVLLGAVLFGQSADAAVISFDPSGGELSLNEEFLVTLHLNSEQEVINAVDITLTYPASALEVIDVSRGGSFLTLWVEDPVVDDTAGTITFAGGIPNGSLVADGVIATVIFRSNAPGGVEIGVDTEATKVLLNDGRGTQAALSAEPSVFTISSLSFVAITSPTHPDENAWYRENDFTAEWATTAGAEYSYTVSARSDTVPDDSRDITDGSATFFSLPDGIHYFILKERLPHKDWRIIGKRRVMVDSTPPLPFTAEIVKERTLYGGKSIVTFTAQDFTSGIARYDIAENDAITQDVTSPYILKDQSLSQAVILWAVDRAGNTTEFSFGGHGSTPGGSSGDPIDILVYVFAGCMFLLLVLVAVRWRIKKKA